MTSCGSDNAPTGPNYDVLTGLASIIQPAPFLTEVGCTLVQNPRDPAVKVRVSVPLTTGERQFFDCFGITPDSLRVAISRYWQEVGRDRPRAASMTSSGSAFNYPDWLMPPEWSDGWGEYRIVDVVRGCGWNPYQPEDLGGYAINGVPHLVDVGTPTEECWVDVAWQWFQYDDPNGQWDDPEAGGIPDESGGGGGGYSSASPASAWLDDTGLPTMNGWVVSDPTPDCRRTLCRKPSVIAFSPAVKLASDSMMKLSMRDSVEYGAWLFRNPDGTVRVGPYQRGTVDLVPQMTPQSAPIDAIGSIHTHWFPPVFPSPWDYSLFQSTNTYGVVASAGWIYVVNSDGTPVGKVKRP